MKPFGKTTSVCPVCLGKIPAQLVEEPDGIYMHKSCWEHGDFRTLIWEGDYAEYTAWGAGDHSIPITPVRAQPVEKGCPYDCGLCQSHERDGCCVLLELTNRCNLRCPVCFASAGDRKPKDLSLAEIGRQYDLLMARGGPFNIQLSGGEPTMRDDLPEIIALGLKKGFSFFQLNTNGVRLANEDGYARHLKEAGVSVAFLQFDGLDDSIYRTLRGTDLLETKLRAIDNCREAGLPVVLVPTVAPGVNDHALGDILRFALSRAPHVRGVHIQPISYFGRCGLDAPEARLTIPAVLRRIEAQTEGLMKVTDFGGGGAESPYCSFHASFMRKSDGTIKALPRRRSQCCCVKSSDARDFVSQQWSGKAAGCDGDVATSSLDEFLQKTVENTFTVSGMVFQDAWNLDLDRLRRCYICEVDTEKGMIPFCAYNLTDIHGRALYRK
ncbi:MAG: radical SAM protein [Oscillospiraceae bacterium]|nr:radical SAM protein [Oscillospiraceae bacterium]